MKLQIILINRKSHGFLIIESIIVISLFTIFIISTFYLKSSINSLRLWSINELNNLKNTITASDLLINSNEIKGAYYGNYSKITELYPFTFSKYDLLNSWGIPICDPEIDYINNITLNNSNLDIGIDTKSTGIEVRNSIIYLSADSSISTLSDLFIIDNRNRNRPSIISSINTGPGVASLSIAGPYIYLANTSSNSQLQIIDIHNRESPHIISQVKLPLPNASSSPARSTSIFYNKGFIFLGTNKWDGPELSIINVKDPFNPYIVSSFETNTLINDIFVLDNTVYIATSDIYQMRIIDITQIENPKLINTFTSTGWEVQQGNVLSIFEDKLVLGRTVGGINRVNNHEIFVFSTSTNINQISSHDIPSGVYGVILSNNKTFILTHDFNKEFQIWDKDSNKKIYEISLNSKPVSMRCDRNTLYFATGDNKGFIFTDL